MRTVRTFVRRSGRASQAQRRVLTEEQSPYRLSMPLTGKWEAWFSRAASRRVVEIGFGMGEALLQYATQYPETDFLGIEVHDKGVAKVLLELQKRRLSNVRICLHDSLEVLAQLPEHALDALHIFFPDPWPKKRHHKRRLVQAQQLPLFASRLKKGGILHIATDWEPYAKEILAVLNASEYFVNTAETYYSQDRRGRPITKFEKRGLALGHTIRDLCFITTLVSV